jgi:hypothetical protein
MGGLSAWLAAGPQLRRVDDDRLRRAGASGDELTFALDATASPQASRNTSRVSRDADYFKPSFFPAPRRRIDSRMRLARVSGRFAV